ncbi:transposase [Deinococcus piscis]|uniref:Transposase n=1 Tax=Deinococcus piscis TaxID=394230 RepID=A0ABQ3KBU3_9DEIO|nr:transposase [Deinococcus piscis]
MGERVKYSREFKLEAIRLASEPDQSVPKVARDLGISDSSLYGWIRQEKKAGERAFPGKGKQNLTEEQAEIKRLRRELEIARQERDVLKKAVAFFAKEN